MTMVETTLMSLLAATRCCLLTAAGMMLRNCHWFSGVGTNLVAKYCPFGAVLTPTAQVVSDARTRQRMQSKSKERPSE